MPDVPWLSLAIIGMYFFLVWLEQNHRRFSAASTVFISLAFLIKIPTAIIGVPLLYLAVVAVRERVAVSKPPIKGGGLETAAPWWALLLASWELWLFALITLGPSA